MKETLFTAKSVTGGLEIVGLANTNNELDLTEFLPANFFSKVLTWAGGDTSHDFTITGITSASVVIPALQSAANAETITAWSLTADTLSITFSGDPGAVVIPVFGTIVAVTPAP